MKQLLSLVMEELMTIGFVSVMAMKQLMTLDDNTPFDDSWLDAIK